MPTGFYIDYECTVTNRFRLSFPNNQSIGALEWLAHIAISQDLYIQHAENSNEKALRMKKLRVDGWCEETKTAFEYSGWYYQRHAYITNRANLPVEAELAERAEKTKPKHVYICDILDRYQCWIYIGVLGVRTPSPKNLPPLRDAPFLKD